MREYASVTDVFYFNKMVGYEAMRNYLIKATGFASVHLENLICCNHD